MIERLVIEVPRNRRLTVSDITIGGEPIQYGGQIAECVTVKLTGIANLPKQPVRNDPVQCSGRCFFKRSDPHAFLIPGVPQRGLVEAFSSQALEKVQAGGTNRRVPRRARPRLRRPMP